MDTNAYSTIRSYIKVNPIATLGTINPDGSPHGAIVYISADAKEPIIYFLTKQQTSKYQNIQGNDHVCLTIVNPSENSTLQAKGRADDVHDPHTINMVMDAIAHDHVSSAQWLPPIAKLRAGAYVVVAITLSHARLAQFKGMVIGDEHIFTTA